MTAEVAILNRIGVALAADSAATIGRGRGGKIYSSADKLFQLSHSDPVGVMVYGNANFIGVPWETIIKEYRREHGKKKFPTVGKHAENFLKFLGGSRKLFPRSAQNENIQDILELHYDDIKKCIYTEVLKHGEDTARFIDKSVSDFLEFVRKQPGLVPVSDVRFNQILEKFSALISEAVGRVFHDFPISNDANEKLQLIGVEMLRRGYFPLSGNSGIVFAGFGQQEVMPAIHAYQMKGMIENHIQFSPEVAHEVATDGEIICPFAQIEILRLFMEGIHPKRLDYMRDSTEELFSETVTWILDILGESAPKISDEVKQKMNSKVQEFVEKKLFHKWEMEKEVYWRSVLRMMPSFPKDEMASVAEILVNLTKFMERITPGPETVGGPIDVAIITKGDGFVWIKRKQYFDPSLNPRLGA